MWPGRPLCLPRLPPETCRVGEESHTQPLQVWGEGLQTQEPRAGDHPKRRQSLQPKVGWISRPESVGNETGRRAARRPSPHLHLHLCPGGSPACRLGGWAVAPATQPSSGAAMAVSLPPTGHQTVSTPPRPLADGADKGRARPDSARPGVCPLCAGPEAGLSPGPCGPPSPGTSAAHPPPWELKGSCARVTAQRCLPPATIYQRSATAVRPSRPRAAAGAPATAILYAA